MRFTKRKRGRKRRHEPSFYSGRTTRLRDRIRKRNETHFNDTPTLQKNNYPQKVLKPNIYI